VRARDWDQLLAAEIVRARDMAFAWGVHDCVTWACQVRRALTGEDAALPWRGRYSTEAGARRVMRRLGWLSIEDGVRAVLGEPLAFVSLAQRGDVVLAGEDVALGVVAGRDALFVAPSGLTQRPLRSCRLAWRV
jgi:hypothetical protein